MSPQPPGCLQNNPDCIWRDAQSSVYLVLIKLRDEFLGAGDSSAETSTPQSATLQFEGYEASDCKSYWVVWTVKCLLRVSVNVLFFFTWWRVGLLTYLFTATQWFSIALENVWEHCQWQPCLLMPHLVTFRREVITLYGPWPHASIFTCSAQVRAVSVLTHRHLDVH